MTHKPFFLLYSFGLRTNAGRRPNCSCPRVGFSMIQMKSPRSGMKTRAFTRAPRVRHLVQSRSLHAIVLAGSYTANPSGSVAASLGDERRIHRLAPQVGLVLLRRRPIGWPKPLVSEQRDCSPTFGLLPNLISIADVSTISPHRSRDGVKARHRWWARPGYTDVKSLALVNRTLGSRCEKPRTPTRRDLLVCCSVRLSPFSLGSGNILIRPVATLQRSGLD